MQYGAYVPDRPLTLRVGIFDTGDKNVDRSLDAALKGYLGIDEKTVGMATVVGVGALALIAGYFIFRR